MDWFCVKMFCLGELLSLHNISLLIKIVCINNCTRTKHDWLQRWTKTEDGFLKHFRRTEPGLQKIGFDKKVSILLKLRKQR